MRMPRLDDAPLAVKIGFAPALAPLLGGQLLVHFGWRSSFWFAAGVAVAVLIAVWFLLAETAPRSPPRAKNVVRDYLDGFRVTGFGGGGVGRGAGGAISTPAATASTARALSGGLKLAFTSGVGLWILYGFVTDDPAVRDSVLVQRAIVEHLPQSPASRCYRIVASRIAGLGPVRGGLRLAHTGAGRSLEVPQCA